MQIDRTNLSNNLPQILQKISHADFISFDCQFTGLTTCKQDIQGNFSNHVQFYQRIKQTGYNFGIIQLGLVAFIYENNEYRPYIYNFYINPNIQSPSYKNIMICQIQSMQFLSKNKLDFERVFLGGIKSTRLYQKNNNIQQQKYQYNKYLQQNVKELQNIYLSQYQLNVVKSIQQCILGKEWEKQEQVFQIKNKILFTYVTLKFPYVTLNKVKKNHKKYQYALKFKGNEKNQFHLANSGNSVGNDSFKQQQQQQNLQKLQKNTQITSHQQVGIQKIFQALISSKKPLVGHYLALDIGLIYQNFIQDLPQNYSQFCQNLTKLFPYIFDSKVISKRLQPMLKGLRIDLSSLYKACSNQRLLKPYSNFNISGLQYYQEKQHQAGYDAFITGCSFIGMVNYLNGQPQRINFASIQKQNLLLYSRSAGEVSLSGNGYASNAINYPSTIIIQPTPKTSSTSWKSTAKKLSKYGTLTVYENHNQTYYVYEQQQNIEDIIKQFPDCQLKKYQQRKIVKARNMFTKYIN